MTVPSIVRAIALFAVALPLALAPAIVASQRSHRRRSRLLELASVRIDGKTLFKVRGATSFPAQVRADAIERRIKSIAEDRSIDLGSLRLAARRRLDRALRGHDANRGPDAGRRAGRAAGAARIRASIVETRVRDAIVEYRAARTTERRISGVLFALGSTVLATLRRSCCCG